MSITNGHLRWATFRSKLSLAVAGSIVGSVAGSIVGSVAGSIVGSVAGSIVGSVAGSIVASVAGSIVAIWPFLTVAVDVDATTNPHTARQAVRTFDRPVNRTYLLPEGTWSSRP
jgi:outer membrane lipoprotein SlyB